jgi:hypothetical protein
MLPFITKKSLRLPTVSGWNAQTGGSPEEDWLKADSEVRAKYTR